MDLKGRLPNLVTSVDEWSTLWPKRSFMASGSRAVSSKAVVKDGSHQGLAIQLHVSQYRSHINRVNYVRLTRGPLLIGMSSSSQH